VEEKSYRVVNVPPATRVRRGVVDLHCHVGVTEDRWWGTIDRFVESARMYGVRKFVILCYEEWMNRYASAAVRRFPEVFAAFGFVDLDRDGRDKVEWLKENGFSGVKTYYNTRPYDHDAYMKVYELTAAWGQPMVFHTGSSPRVHPYTLRRILREFPGWRIIGAHLGADAHREAAEVLREHPELYYDLSGSIVCRYPYEYLGEVLSWEGAWERIVFGSDAACGHFASYVLAYEDAMERLGVDPAVRDKVFYGNALELISGNGRMGRNGGEGPSADTP